MTVIARSGKPSNTDTTVNIDVKNIKRFRAGQIGDDIFLMVSTEEKENIWFRADKEDNKELFEKGILPNPESLPEPKVPKVIYGAWVDVVDGAIIERRPPQRSRQHHHHQKRPNSRGRQASGY